MVTPAARREAIALLREKLEVGRPVKVIGLARGYPI
jgi:hypothetical protein